MEQTSPEMGPIVEATEFEQAQPDDPIHVRRNQPAQQHEVADAPGLPLQIQQSKFAGAFRMVQTMIDAARKIFEPTSCLSGDAGEDLRDGASDIECSHETVEA